MLPLSLYSSATKCIDANFLLYRRWKRLQLTGVLTNGPGETPDLTPPRKASPKSPIAANTISILVDAHWSTQLQLSALAETTPRLSHSLQYVRRSELTQRHWRLFLLEKIILAFRDAVGIFNHCRHGRNQSLSWIRFLILERNPSANVRSHLVRDGRRIQNPNNRDLRRWTPVVAGVSRNWTNSNPKRHCVAIYIWKFIENCSIRCLRQGEYVKNSTRHCCFNQWFKQNYARAPGNHSTSRATIMCRGE